MQFEPELSSRLKTAIDLSELRREGTKGVEFEVDDEDLREKEDGLDNLGEFDKNCIASNICQLSDDERDQDEDNRNPEFEYLTEIERLSRRMIRNPSSDLTPNKDGGVLKMMKKVGAGSCVPEGSLVQIHYNAYLDIGEAPFDSTRLRGRPVKKRLGKGELVLGVEMSVLSMKKGETARFLIDYKYAYGEMGVPPRIPPKATIIMDIELIWFVDKEGVDDYFAMTPEERRSKMTIEDIKKVVRSINDEGKEYFKNNNFKQALSKYDKSTNVLESYGLKSQAEEEVWKKELFKTYLNAAVCSSKLYQSGQTVTRCSRALDLYKDSDKALLHRARALLSMRDFERARSDLQRARKLNPNSRLISEEIIKLDKAMAADKEREKVMFRRMMSVLKDDDVKEESKPNSTNEDGQDAPDYWKCRQQFAETVKVELQKFKDDNSLYEFPFPSHQLTPGEIHCILETAKEMGLDVKQKGTGNSTNYEVFKKPPKI